MDVLPTTVVDAPGNAPMEVARGRSVTGATLRGVDHDNDVPLLVGVFGKVIAVERTVKFAARLIPTASG